jgi:hypothetical protein
VGQPATVSFGFLCSRCELSAAGNTPFIAHFNLDDNNSRHETWALNGLAWSIVPLCVYYCACVAIGRPGERAAHPLCGLSY